MVAQFSCDATSAERKKLWNPSKTLGIINMDSGYQCITCIGYAPSQGRRCRNPIKNDNREFIMETLDDIAYLHPDSPAVTSRLRAIAGPALCVRYHQNQAETVVMQWQRKLQQLPQIGERKPTKPIQRNKKQEFIQDQSVENVKEQLREARELLAKLQGEINNQRHQDQGSERREEQGAKDRQEEERKRRRSEKREREARRQEKDRLEQELLEKERLEKERLEKKRLEKKRLEKKRLEKERLEKERLDKERREREEEERRERDQTAKNERMRQRAQKVREEREREKREREQKEREEWDQSWKKYQELWVHFKASAPGERNVQDAIPWPVKSGSYRDVTASKVKEFLERAVPMDAHRAKLLRKECLKWHPDMICRLLRGYHLTEVNQMMVDMICRVVTDLLNNSAGRSAEFLG
jgi:hypothetical protein